MSSLHNLVAASAIAIVSVPANAQTVAPPIRNIGTTAHASRPDFASIASVRPLSNGSVLINDLTGRRVVLLDSTLSNEKVIADSTTATATAYSSRLGGLIPYRGDSTLFVDPLSQSMLVLDGNGKVARVMAVPKQQDANFLIGGPFGYPGFDSNGKLVYRTQLRGPIGAPGPDGQFVIPPPIDSAPIVRFDLAERHADTAAFLKVFAPRMKITQAGGRVSITSKINPLAVTDDWALRPDGSIAIIRGTDFHVDVLKPDGTVLHGTKIPFNWQRLSDSAKQVIVDSARVVLEAGREKLIASLQGAQNSGGSSTTTTPAPTGGTGGGANMTFTMRVDGGSPPAGAPAARNNAAIELPPIEFVPFGEMADYRPAFTGGAARSDADGNVWVRTSEMANGRPIYFVVNGEGQLIDRVQIPAGRTITGFGVGGVVYMAVRDGANGVRLETARMK